MRAQIAITRNGIDRHLSRQDTCLRLVLRALGILERVNEPLFMSNLEIYDRKRPPTCMLSQNLVKLAELDLAGEDAPTALLEVSAAAIENLISVGQNSSMRVYFLALPEETDWPAEVPATGAPSTKGSAPWMDDGFPSYTTRPSRYKPRSTTTAL